METNSTAKTRDVLLKDVGNLKDDVVQTAQHVKERASVHVDETRQRVNDHIQSAQDTLTSHPFALLGVGFALGFLFGLRFR